MRTHHGVLGDGEVRARDFGMPPPHPPPLREEEDPLDDPRRPEVPHGVHGEVNPRPDPKTGTGDRGREWRARAAANLHEVEGLDEDALRRRGGAEAVVLEVVDVVLHASEAESSGPVAIDAK